MRSGSERLSGTIAGGSKGINELFQLVAKPSSSTKEIKKAIKSASKDLRRTNDRSQTVFHVAAEAGHLEALKLLLTPKLRLGDLIHAPDAASAWRPLHYAAQAGHIECVELLISQGADLRDTTQGRDTVLHYLVRSRAITSAYYKVLNSIMSTKGVDINAQNNNGETPLHLAALSGNDDAVKMLLDHNAIVDLLTRRNETPLHYACRSGHISAIKLLLQAHSDVTIASSDGTPLQIAERWQHPEVADLIRSALPPARRTSLPDTPLSSMVNSNSFSPIPSNKSAPMSSIPQFELEAQQRADYARNSVAKTQQNYTQQLLAYCRVNAGHALSPPLSWPASPPLPAFLMHIDSLLGRCRQFNHGYDFAYERGIMSHVQKEREDQQALVERFRVYSEHLKNSQTYNPATVNLGPSINNTPTSNGVGAGTHPFVTGPVNMPGGEPAKVEFHRGGACEGERNLSTSQPVHVNRNVLANIGKAKTASLGNINGPTGGVPVLPMRPRTTSNPKPPPLNPVQEKLYLKIISEHEELNTEIVHIAVRKCPNDPKSVISYIKAYDRLKPIGYSQAHVIEALNAYGGGAMNLTPQEEERQHQRMLAFLKLLVNKGYSPAGLVQDALSLHDYDADKAEKFLASYKTVAQMGFPEAKIREALLMNDSDSEKAIRYLLA